MQKIAVFGGTFNPIHNGHIKTANYFASTLNFDKIFFIPTNIPPHKSNASVISAEDRLNMCNLAVQDYPIFEVSDIEILRPGKSYTVDTLREFRKMYLSAEIFLIMGADMFLTLMEWYRPLEIFKMATICTVPRDDNDYETLKEYAEKLKVHGLKSVIKNTPLIDISSTDIRDRIKNNCDVCGMVPDDVLDYILRNNLYQR